MEEHESDCTCEACLEEFRKLDELEDPNYDVHNGRYDKFNK